VSIKDTNKGYDGTQYCYNKRVFGTTVIV